MMQEVEHLAQMRVEFETARKKFEADSRLTDSFITPFRLRLEMAIVDALVATHRMSDEYQMVLTMLTPQERGELIAYGAICRKAGTDAQARRSQGAA